MKLSLHLTPEGEEKLKELLLASDGKLLSTLHKFGITQLCSEIETIPIPPPLTFWERCRSLLGLPPRHQIRSKPPSAPERALEILGMLIQAHEAVGTAIRTRFIVALERAAERADSNALELLAGALSPNEALAFSSAQLFQRELLEATGVVDVATLKMAEASAKLFVIPTDGDAEAPQKIAATAHSSVPGARTLLEAVCASPLAQAKLQRTVSNLDSMQSATFQSGDSGSNADAVVVVQTAIKDLAHLAEEKEVVVRQALGQLALSALSPLPELRWQLKRGPIGIGTSMPGDPLPERFDVAWDLLTSFALAAVAHGEASAPDMPKTAARDIRSEEIENKRLVKAEQSVSRYVTRALDYMSAGVSELSSQVTALTNPRREILHLSKQLRLICESGLLLQDEMLKLRIAARVVASEGNLSWQDCLALTNARSRFHQFLDASDPTTQAGFTHKVTAQKGGLIVHVSVKERRLSVGLREHYEKQRLHGRIQVLSELVEFAKREHATPIQISSEQIAKRTEVDNEELLRAIRRKTAN